MNYGMMSMFWIGFLSGVVAILVLLFAIASGSGGGPDDSYE